MRPASTTLYILSLLLAVLTGIAVGGDSTPIAPGEQLVAALFVSILLSPCAAFLTLAAYLDSRGH